MPTVDWQCNCTSRAWVVRVESLITLLDCEQSSLAQKNHKIVFVFDRIFLVLGFPQQNVGDMGGLYKMACFCNWTLCPSLRTVWMMIDDDDD